MIQRRYNRLVILSMIVLLLYVSIAQAVYTQEDSITDAVSAGEGVYVGSGGGNDEAGFPWTAGSDYDLTKVEVQLNKAGSPTGNVYCKVYLESGGNPGVLLGTSTNQVATSAIGAAIARYNFTFAPIPIASGSTYFITCTKTILNSEVFLGSSATGGARTIKYYTGAAWNSWSTTAKYWFITYSGSDNNVQAVNVYNGTAIQSYSASITNSSSSWVQYTSTGEMQISSGSLVNITFFNITHHFNKTYTDINMSTSILANISSYPIIGANSVYNQSLNLSNITLIIRGMTYSGNATYRVPEEGTYNITASAPGYETRDVVNYANNYTYHISLIPDLNKKILLQNALGQNVTSICSYNGTQYSSYELNLQTYYSNNNNLACQADTNYIAETYTVLNNSETQIFTRQVNRLIMNFSSLINGSITTEEQLVTYFYNNTLSIVQSTIPTGKVTVSFGNLNLSAQKYQYENDWNTYINTPVIKIIANPTIPIYVHVQSKSAQGIGDASITVYEFETYSTTNQNASLVGRYLSNNRLPTLIWLDASKKYKFVVEKTGYETSSDSEPIDPNDVPDSTHIIELATSSPAIKAVYTVHTYPYILTNETINDSFILYVTLPTIAPIPTTNSNLIYYTTSYREAHGAANGFLLKNIDNETKYWALMTNFRDCTDSVLLVNCRQTRSYSIELIEGEDYSRTDTTVTVYIKALYTTYHSDTITLYVIQMTRTSDIDIHTDTGWESKTIITLSFILMISITMFIRYFTQNNQIASSTFKIGIILIMFIAQQILFAGVLCILYFGGIWLKKINGGE